MFGREKARINSKGVVFIRKGMLLNRIEILSNKQKVLFIKTGVLFNRKEIVSAKKGC